MNPMKIKDNESREKEKFYQVKSIASCVSDKTLEQLEREGVFVFPEIMKDAEDITKNQMILQSCNDMYCTGNVMGFLGSGDERLIIESRFSRGENDYFFQYLLEKVLDFPNFISLDTNANQEERMFNLLLSCFLIISRLLLGRAHSRHTYAINTMMATCGERLILLGISKIIFHL